MNRTYELEKDWITKSGLRAICLLMKLGIGNHRCGYVQTFEPIKDLDNIEVHGGVTYSDNFLQDIDENTWWIGFDTIHSMDHEFNKKTGKFIYSNKDLNFVVKECESLADQCVKLGANSKRRPNQ